MLSLRNGTAIAIVLSIVFVVFAVAGRDQLPGFADDSGNSATSMANGPVGTEDPANTGAEAQIGQSTSLGIGSAEPTQEAVWGGEYDDDDDGDHHDGDDHEDHDDHDDDDDHDD